MKTKCALPGCGKTFEQPWTGRKRKYCGDACRKQAERDRRKAK